MRVLHFIKTFLPFSETFIFDQLKRLEVDNSIDSRVLTNKLENRNYFDLEFIYEVHSYRRRLKRIYDRIFRISYTTEVLELVKLFKPHIIHAHFGVNGVSISQLLERNSHDIPILVSFHGSDITHYPLIDSEYSSSLKTLFNRENCFFTVNSHYLMNVLVTAGAPKEKVFFQPNALNNGFAKVNRDFESEKELLKLLCVARLEPIKGHRYLIEAFASFSKLYHGDVELTLIGSGSLKKELVELIEKLGVSNEVKLLGAVAHEELPQIFSQHDIYIQPSITSKETGQQEAFGVSVIEALAVGLPVIVTKTGGLLEAMEYESKHSIAIEESSSQAIVDALFRVINNGSLKSLNKELQEKIRNGFSERACHSKLLNIYKKILNDTK